MTLHRIITTKIEKMMPDGTGLGFYTDKTIQANNKPIRVWGAFTGETIEVETYKRQGGSWYGVLHKVIESPLRRIEPKDSTYFSSSPWQGISLDDELVFKLEIARMVFAPIPEIAAQLDQFKPSDIVHNGRIYGYRNKMEYHMYEDGGEYGQVGNIIISIFGRKEKRRVPMETNSLAVPGLHDFAQKCIADIAHFVPVGRSLKTLIVRSVDQLRAALFVKDMTVAEQIKNVLTTPATEHEIEFSNTYKDVLTIYYSNPDSPASVIDATLYEPEHPQLHATLANTKLEFGLMSFFQINLGLADRLLVDITRDIADRVTVLPEHSNESINILDYYSGVGTIGLVVLNSLKQSLAPEVFSKIHLTQVEENKQASAYAVENTKQLGLESQSTIFCGNSEDFTEHVTAAHIVIVDPPRSGLHPKFVRQLLIDRPPFVIYQSCNIESMVRDLKHLQAEYEIGDIGLYNFFPRTPHLEAYIVLKRKEGV